MATSYETLLPDIIPVVPTCPDTLIEGQIRAAAIEFCEKTGIYQAELDAVTTVGGTYEYELEPPTGTSVHKIMWATYDGKDLEPISTSLLEQRVPDWRNSSHYGDPEYFVKQGTNFWLVPVPSATLPQSTILRVQLKPTHRSNSCDDSVMGDYRDAIVNGALYRLLRMPGREWTDYSGAQIYGSLFAEGLVRAEREARHADQGVARKVRYGGLNNKTRHSKRGWRSAY